MISTKPRDDERPITMQDYTYAQVKDQSGQQAACTVGLCRTMFDYKREYFPVHNAQIDLAVQEVEPLSLQPCSYISAMIKDKWTST